MPETACGFKSRSSHHTHNLTHLNFPTFVNEFRAAVIFGPAGPSTKTKLPFSKSCSARLLTCPSAIFVTLSSKLSIFDQKPCLKIAGTHPKAL